MFIGHPLISTCLLAKASNLLLKSKRIRPIMWFMSEFLSSSNIACMSPASSIARPSDANIRTGSSSVFTLSSGNSCFKPPLATKLIDGLLIYPNKMLVSFSPKQPLQNYQFRLNRSICMTNLTTFIWYTFDMVLMNTLLRLPTCFTLDTQDKQFLRN